MNINFRLLCNRFVLLYLAIILFSIPRLVLASGDTSTISSQDLINFKKEYDYLHNLHKRVVEFPENRVFYRNLLETLLELHGQGDPHAQYSISTRQDILLLKEVMEDIGSIKESIREIESLIELNDTQIERTLLKSKVPPAYRRSVPMSDPWGTPYRVIINPKDGRYKIVSAGSDKKFESVNLAPPPLKYNYIKEERSSKMENDIVYVDGSNFTKIFDYPKSAQTYLYTPCHPADEILNIRCY